MNEINSLSSVFFSLFQIREIFKNPVLRVRNQKSWNRFYFSESLIRLLGISNGKLYCFLSELALSFFFSAFLIFWILKRKSALRCRINRQKFPNKIQNVLASYSTSQVVTIRVTSKFPLLGWVLVFFFLSIYCSSESLKHSSSQNSETNSPSTLTAFQDKIDSVLYPEHNHDPELLKVLAGGDVMFNWGIRDTIQKHGEIAPVKGLKSLFREADFRMVNLETPVVASKTEESKKAYIFTAHEKDLDSLKFLGVDMVFLGNNHSFDHGQRGMDETLSILNKNNILNVGAGKKLPQVLNPLNLSLKGTDLRIHSVTAVAERSHYATPTKSGVAPFMLSSLQAAFFEKHPSRFKNHSSPIRIVSLHWGIEYSPFPTSDQRKIARTLIDSGVKIVIGHHPHIPQGVEIYRGGVILYSLGNLIFGSRNSYLNHNLVAIFHIRRNRLERVELVPIFGKFQKEDHRIRPVIGREAQEFLHEIAVLSAEFGTRFRIEGDRAFLDLPTNSPLTPTFRRKK
ncbi:CapA family protein [Leptospira borgpetersenii]|uniref:CapA family protein n=1 Tax=Leptospira borgpetersenii TaxID=174 RepID=UPI0007DE2509|nr:CapA family protein [Leptospira borgpetersenii]ANH00738.1 Bacterial capsule synthesis protein [Leptospira borgpetersenii str. 4E]